MNHTADRNLLAILLNPPLSGGSRTLNRVQLGARLVGIEANRVTVCNLCTTATRSSKEISLLSFDDPGWDIAAKLLDKEIARSTDILFAWGTTAPSGEARVRFVAQLDVISGAIARAPEVRIWLMNGRTTHPSRWQRETARAFPNDSFAASLPRLFRKHTVAELPAGLFGGTSRKHDRMALDTKRSG